MLAHESPGIDEEAEFRHNATVVNRFPARFASFFACSDGATPRSLVSAGIYNKVLSDLDGT